MMAPSTMTILPSFVSVCVADFTVESVFALPTEEDTVLRIMACCALRLGPHHVEEGHCRTDTLVLLQTRLLIYCIRESPHQVRFVSQSATAVTHPNPFPLPCLLCRRQRGTNIKSCLSITSPSPSLQASIVGARCWSACVVYRSTQHQQTCWI